MSKYIYIYIYIYSFLSIPIPLDFNFVLTTSFHIYSMLIPAACLGFRSALILFLPCLRFCSRVSPRACPATATPRGSGRFFPAFISSVHFFFFFFFVNPKMFHCSPKLGAAGTMTKAVFMEKTPLSIPRNPPVIYIYFYSVNILIYISPCMFIY